MLDLYFNIFLCVHVPARFAFQVERYVVNIKEGQPIADLIQCYCSLHPNGPALIYSYYSLHDQLWAERFRSDSKFPADVLNFHGYGVSDDEQASDDKCPEELDMEGQHVHFDTAFPAFLAATCWPRSGRVLSVLTCWRYAEPVLTLCWAWFGNFWPCVNRVLTSCCPYGGPVLTM